MRAQEEKTAWKDKMYGFVKQIRALSQEDRETLSNKMPVTTCEGHALSVYNQCMLAMQSKTPLTIIGGFNQWKKSGRKVSSGQHTIGYIYVPMIQKTKNDEPKEISGLRVHMDKEVRFRLIPVFDVSQTEELAA